MTLHVPCVHGLDLTAAALAYADAGWFVLPTSLQTKHAGSVLGKGWPDSTSRDPQQIRRWFGREDRGLALHVGRSGALAFDVDVPSDLPELLSTALLASATPLQSTRVDVPERGHHLFRQPPDEVLGNGKGQLSGNWGEVRGKNGVIMAEPTTHEKASKGGRYTWIRTGELAPLPVELHQALTGHNRGNRAARAVLSTPRQRRPATRRRHARPLSLQAIVEMVLVAEHRNNAIFEASCRLGELVAVGMLTELTAVQMMTAAGTAVGLDSVELLGADGRSGTIYSGIRIGLETVRTQ